MQICSGSNPDGSLKKLKYYKNIIICSEKVWILLIIESDQASTLY